MLQSTQEHAAAITELMSEIDEHKQVMSGNAHIKLSNFAKRLYESFKVVVTRVEELDQDHHLHEELVEKIRNGGCYLELTRYLNHSHKGPAALLAVKTLFAEDKRQEEAMQESPELVETLVEFLDPYEEDGRACNKALDALIAMTSECDAAKEKIIACGALENIANLLEEPDCHATNKEEIVELVGKLAFDSPERSAKIGAESDLIRGLVGLLTHSDSTYETKTAVVTAIQFLAEAHRPNRAPLVAAGARPFMRNMLRDGEFANYTQAIEASLCSLNGA